MLVHVRPGDPARGNLHLGPALPASARRRITCDTNVAWVLEDQGQAVAWGRRRPTVPGVLRRLIEDRDRGCRVPACTQVRWNEVHHLVHVEDGGDTLPDNLACLCPRHHDEHHRGLLGIAGDPSRPDGLEFTDRWGRRIEPPPPKPGGLEPQGRWEAPSGERFDTRWFTWSPVPA